MAATKKSNHISGQQMRWRVNTFALFKEILINEQCAILKMPLNILMGILQEVAARSLELNDPLLTALMCRLALYEQADPYSKEYAGGKAISSVIEQGYKKTITPKSSKNANTNSKRNA